MTIGPVAVQNTAKARTMCAIRWPKKATNMHRSCGHAQVVQGHCEPQSCPRAQKKHYIVAYIIAAKWVRRGAHERHDT